MNKKELQQEILRQEGLEMPNTSESGGPNAVKLLGCAEIRYRRSKRLAILVWTLAVGFILFGLLAPIFESSEDLPVGSQSILGQTGLMGAIYASQLALWLSAWWVIQWIALRFQQVNCALTSVQDSLVAINSRLDDIETMSQQLKKPL